MSFIFRIGAQDLSSYVRVGPQDGMDPYGSGWAEPVFADAPATEGKLLLGTNINSREMIWPLFLKGVGQSASGGTAYSTAVSSDTPAQYLRVNESGGSTAADTSGNAHTGTYGSGVTKNVTGLLVSDSDTAASFDGTSNGVITTSYTPFSGTMTFEGVAKVTDFVAGRVLFGDSNSTINLSAGSGTFTLEPNRFGGGTTGSWTGVTGTGAGTVYHWALTWNMTSNSAELFINGVSQGVKSALKAVASPGTLQWGNMAGGFAGAWLGVLDELAVYSGALSAARILVHATTALNGPQGGTPAIAGKDVLHALIQTVNNEIANPTTSPLRVEWKDSGASNSTFYDVAAARIDPHFNYRLSEHTYADLALHVWCTPPYGHTATERIIATAAGTAPGLTASLIGVASPLTGDVAPQLRVTVNTSGEAVGPAGRGVIVAAPNYPAYIPFISAASFASRHPSSAIIGASGAPGSQAIARQPPTDTGELGRIGLGATMYAGRNRVYAAVLPGQVGAQAVWAVDGRRRPVGPTALAYRPDGFQILDLGVISVPTYTPTTDLSVYSGAVLKTYDDSMFGRPLPTGAGGSALLAIAGLYVIPEDSIGAALDTSAKPLARSVFGASGTGSSAFPGTFVGDYGETWQSTTTPGSGGKVFSASGAFLFLDGGVVRLNTSSVRDYRCRTVYHPMQAPGAALMRAGVSSDATGVAGAYVEMAAQSATQLMINIVGGTYLASMVIASSANFPLQNTANGLVVDVWRQDNKMTLNARWAKATGISYVPSAGMSATTVPVASVGVTDSRVRSDGVPFLYSTSSQAFSFAQFDELQDVPQPSDAYRLTSVTGDTQTRSPISGSGPNVSLAGARRGVLAPKISPSYTGIVAVDWQLDGGPMNDPMGVDVRCRERFSYAR